MKLKNRNRQVRNFTIPITISSLIITLVAGLIPENPDSIVYYVKIISEGIFWGGIIVLAWLFLAWFEKLFEKHMRRKIVEDYEKYLVYSFQNPISFEREGPDDWIQKKKSF